jgi:hypothetical protein
MRRGVEVLRELHRPLLEVLQDVDSGGTRTEA